VRSKFREWNGIVKTRSAAIEPAKKPVSVPGGTSVKQNDLKSGNKAIKPTSSSNSKQSGVGEDSYNGRITDKYSWSQTINEVDVKVPVSSEIKKGKQLNVTITNNDIKILVPGQAEGVLLHGKFSFPVKKDDCYWNLVPGEAIRIWLQKSQERYS